MTKQQKIRRAACIGAVFAAAGAVFARSEYERHHFTVTTYRVGNGSLPKSFEGYRIAVLADLHANRFGKNNCRLIRELLKQRPDAVIIAGDALVAKPGKKMETESLEAVFAFCRRRGIPVYFGNGNHEARMMEDGNGRYRDWYRQLERLLERYGVNHPVNQVSFVRRGDEQIAIADFEIPEQYYRKKFHIPEMDPEEIERAVGKKGECFTILLAHSPLFARTCAQWGADVTVSGHFHGGTIRLPKFGGLMSPQFQFFSGYDRGCYEIKEGQYQVTSAGLGTHSINLRLNNMSELVMLELVRTNETCS